MILQINSDHQRFRKIVRGKIRKNLRKFLTRSELLGREGKKYISIPVRGIDIPHFRYGDNNDSGVGRGDGKAGDTVGDGDGAGRLHGGRKRLCEPGSFRRWRRVLHDHEHPKRSDVRRRQRLLERLDGRSRHHSELHLGHAEPGERAGY